MLTAEERAERVVRAAARANAWADAKYARGLCIQCGRRPHAKDRLRCRECGVKLQLRKREPLARRCSRCRVVDTHDARTCPTRGAS